MARTLLRGINPDPSASLRVLVNRNLRKPTIAARANADVQRVNIDSSDRNYWVDWQAGFSAKDPTDSIQFLLSIDDDPEVLPNS